MKKALRILVLIIALSSSILLFQNCAEVVLLGKVAETIVPDIQPDVDDSPTTTPDPDVIETEYKAPPEDMPNPLEGTAETSWQRQVDNECIPATTNMSGYPNNNVVLSREKNPKDPNCNQFIRPSYQLINGCRLYDRDEVNAFSQLSNLQPWTIGQHYIVNNLPIVIHQPYETVSFKIREDEFFKLYTTSVGGDAYRGQLSLYYDVHALISVTTTPCTFKKPAAVSKFCQRNATDRMSYVSKKSSPEFLRLVEEHPEYNICVLDEADYYYVNIRFIDQADLGNPNKSTCTQKWCSYMFGFE